MLKHFTEKNLRRLEEPAVIVFNNSKYRASLRVAMSFQLFTASINQVRKQLICVCLNH